MIKINNNFAYSEKVVALQPNILVSLNEELDGSGIFSDVRNHKKGRNGVKIDNLFFTTAIKSFMIDNNLYIKMYQVLLRHLNKGCGKVITDEIFVSKHKLLDKDILVETDTKLKETVVCFLKEYNLTFMKMGENY